MVRYSQLLLVSVLAAGSANAQTARTVAQRALPSVVLVIMSDANGQPISLGSGFFVKDGLVATNVHVIAGAVQGRVKLPGQSRTYSITGTVGIDQLNDLALLKVSGQSLPPLLLGRSDNMSVGDDVFVAGNPEGLEGTLSSGIVSAVRQIEEHKLLQITAPISPGSSGGPVLNSQGEVIGVAVATYKGGQNLNFAVPSSYLTALLANVKAESPLSANSRKSAPASDDLGGNLTDGIQITHRTLDCYFKKLSFSIRNSLPHAIENVRLLFIFRDKSGDPLDSVERTFYERISPGLAKAVGHEDAVSVPNQALHDNIGSERVIECFTDMGQFSDQPSTYLTSRGKRLSGQVDFSFIEIRVLGFRMIDD